MRRSTTLFLVLTPCENLPPGEGVWGFFTDAKTFINQEKWLEMWQECMEDKTITQVDAKKIRATGNSNAVLEIAKYSAKGQVKWNNGRKKNGKNG